MWPSPSGFQVAPSALAHIFADIVCVFSCIRLWQCRSALVFGSACQRNAVHKPAAFTAPHHCLCCASVAAAKMANWPEKALQPPLWLSLKAFFCVDTQAALAADCHCSAQVYPACAATFDDPAGLSEQLHACTRGTSRDNQEGLG